MESLVYFFGKDKDTYYQYPTDYTKDFFTRELTYARNKAQIAIHRDGNLLFYSYIRQLDSKESLIGISFATDCILLDYKDLFSSLETFFSILADSGTIIMYNGNGQVVINPHPFSDDKVYLEELSSKIKTFIAEIPKSKKKILPAQDFSVSKDDCKKLSLEDGNTEIALALNSYSNVYISTTKQEIETVTSVGAQIREKTERIQQLEIENEKIKKQKKQYRLVLLLGLVLMGCVVGLIAFNNNVESLKSELEDKTSTISSLRSDINDKNSTIDGLNSTISSKNSTISSLRADITNLQSQIEELKEDKQTLIQSMAKLPPLLITDLKMGIVYKNGDVYVEHGKTLYSSSTMYLSPLISYYGIRSESVTLKMKLYKPNGSLAYNSDISPSGFTNKTEMYTGLGNNEYRLTGWGNETKGFWGSGDYRIEIWYNSSCIYSKAFTIY